MTRPEAIKLKESLLDFCKDKGLWVAVSEERKPDLKTIKLEISLKIDK